MAKICKILQKKLLKLAKFWKKSPNSENFANFGIGKLGLCEQFLSREGTTVNRNFLSGGTNFWASEGGKGGQQKISKRGERGGGTSY